MNFNARKLYQKLSLSDSEFDTWLKNMGLLHSKRTCGSRMKLLNPKKDKRYGNWRCARKSCKKENGFLVGTQFEGTHLSLKEVFQISYYVARQTHTQEEIQFDMQREDGSTLSRESIVDWKSIFCEAFGWNICNNPVIIGGPGITVEIGETVLTKRKYHRGQLRAEEQWFFGGVERNVNGGDSSKCFLVAVERRNADTLLPIIARHVAEGTTIVSDGWAAYGGIERIQMVQSGNQAYQHFVVNHSENFVNPNNANTQTIESTWSHFKARHKEERGTSRKAFASYLFQFLKKYKGPDVLYYLWQEIAKLYPCEQVADDEDEQVNEEYE